MPGQDVSSHMCEMDMEHFAIPNLSVVFAGFKVSARCEREILCALPLP